MSAPGPEGRPEPALALATAVDGELGPRLAGTYDDVPDACAVTVPELITSAATIGTTGISPASPAISRRRRALPDPDALPSMVLAYTLAARDSCSHRLKGPPRPSRIAGCSSQRQLASASGIVSAARHAVLTT